MLREAQAVSAVRDALRHHRDDTLLWVNSAKLFSLLAKEDEKAEAALETGIIQSCVRRGLPSERRADDIDRARGAWEACHLAMRRNRVAVRRNLTLCFPERRGLDDDEDAGAWKLSCLRFVDGLDELNHCRTRWQELAELVDTPEAVPWTQGNHRATLWGVGFRRQVVALLLCHQAGMDPSSPLSGVRARKPTLELPEDVVLDLCGAMERLHSLC